MPPTPRRVADEEVAASSATSTATSGPSEPLTPKIIEPVPIQLDRRRTMRMDFKAMIRFHQATGLSPWSRDVWDDPAPEIMAALIWASLLHEDPDLKLEAVYEMPNLDMGNIGYISDRLGELWGVSMPEAEQEAAKESGSAPNLPSPPNGSSSGPSEESTSG